MWESYLVISVEALISNKHSLRSEKSDFSVLEKNVKVKRD